MNKLLRELREKAISDYFDDLHAGFWGQCYDLTDPRRREEAIQKIHTIWTWVEDKLAEELENEAEDDRSELGSSSKNERASRVQSNGQLEPSTIPEWERLWEWW